MIFFRVARRGLIFFKLRRYEVTPVGRHLNFRASFWASLLISQNLLELIYYLVKIFFFMSKSNLNLLIYNL